MNIKIFNFSKKSNVKLGNMLLNLKKDLDNSILGVKKFMGIKSTRIKEFNEKINEEYRQNQNDFCKNITVPYNQEFEQKIKLSKIIFNNITYFMYVYKQKDIVSHSIVRRHIWEIHETYSLINGLNFYKKKKKLIKNDIYILDVGGNIGWYTFLFGKLGYNIITFEPSKINFYILNKNYCLNKNLNVTLINKGLFSEEKKCYIFSKKNNIGNGKVKCHERANINTINNGEIILTKLSNYIPFLESKNLAMIKMDIEGSEGKALESGIELITKYHVPFIFMEFAPPVLSKYGTNPQILLETFISNGYKINMLNFFEKKNYKIKDLLKGNKSLYIVYIPFLK